MQYAPTIFTTYYRSRVGMLTIICVDTYVLQAASSRDETQWNRGNRYPSIISGIDSLAV